MFRKSEQLVPISVVEKLVDMHYKHLEQITKIFTDHLKPQMVAPMGSVREKMWMSEEEEDEEFLSMKGELAAIADRAKEMGIDVGELSIER